MAQPRDVVQAPPARPPLYGLLAAAPTVDDPAMRWIGGWRFMPEGCGVGGRRRFLCEGNVAAMTAADSPEWVEGEPVWVFASDACSTLGSRTRDWEGRARRQLAAIESAELAEELWLGTTTNANALATPGAPTLTEQDAGGTLATGTYSYRVSAVNEYGESLAGPATTEAVVSTGTDSIKVDWAAVPGASGYHVYGRTGGSELRLTTVPVVGTTYTDTGAATPSGALPAANTTAYAGNRHLAGPAADSDTVTTAAATPVAAVACITAGLADTLRGQQGMVHVTPQLLTHLQAESVVTRQGNLWVTAMGHIVVADAGYTGEGPGGVAAGATQWIYGTPVIQVRQGPVTILGNTPEEVNRETNDIAVYAGRLAGFQWTTECAHLAAEVDVPTCAIGGAA